MMRLFGALALTVAFIVPGTAQDAVPDIKGVWAGDFDFVIIGNNIHHPGGQTTSDPPRSGALAFTVEVEGQDERRAWGRSWSNPDTKEPTALVIAPDNKTIVGADTDGVLNITLLSADSMQFCYSHSSTSQSKSIVAACGIVERQK
jgi:hypothetical protein